ncbi:MAG: flagellar biosynthesis protein FliQ [Fibrobacter sp.]|nr:flagellar biosynthesis protein FliQ [Fibrobacter sp.]
MEPGMVIDIGRQAIWITLLISGPMLIAGLAVGLIVGVFQAVTQIHEMTLTFIPKILVMVFVFLMLLPWMLITLVDYMAQLFDIIGKVTG